jgi:hypothetical protein
MIVCHWFVTEFRRQNATRYVIRRSLVALGTGCLAVMWCT